ncbi:GNAT family N-acetyltransferase [Phenylobacterium sp.]|uniref:GNAT family N-acetyltransferase n=1 Tax=Phenylobacterium sp. TaxID=1871053 RepID=UPI002ED8B5E7
MGLNIRTLGRGDAAALSLAGQATFLETYASALPAADILAHCRHEHGEARYGEWLGKAGYDFWGAEAEQGALVGYVMLCPPDLPTDTAAEDLEIKRIYLLSKYQGGGVGARLLNTALERARALGAGRLWLAVWSQNANAIAFYARQGFTQAGVRKFQVGANTYDDLVLARDL